MLSSILKVVAVEVVKTSAVMGLLKVATSPTVKAACGTATDKAKQLAKSVSGKVVSGAAEGSCYISNKLAGLRASMEQEPTATPEAAPKQEVAEKQEGGTN